MGKGLKRQIFEVNQLVQVIPKKWFVYHHMDIFSCLWRREWRVHTAMKHSYEKPFWLILVPSKHACQHWGEIMKNIILARPILGGMASFVLYAR